MDIIWSGGIPTPLKNDRVGPPKKKLLLSVDFDGRHKRRFPSSHGGTPSSHPFSMRIHEHPSRGSPMTKAVKARVIPLIGT